MNYKKHNKSNILVIGSYGSSNIGDDAILDLMLHNLKDTYNIKVLVGNNFKINKNNISSACHLPFGFRSFFSFKWIKSFKYLKDCNIVLIGGGGLFTDSYSLKAVFLWAWHILWAKIFKKNIILFSNSVGPFRTKIGKIVSKWAINQCKKIIVRDEISKKCVLELLPDKDVILGTDIVFAYDIPQLIRNKIDKNKRDKKVAINIRDLKYNKFFIGEFIEYLVKNEYKVFLISMEDDDKRVLSPYINNDVILISTKDFYELVEVLSNCEICIGMRLHFLIAASLANCRVGAISYSTKVEGIMNDIDVPFIDVENMNIELLKKLFQDAKKAENLEEMRSKAESMFEEVRLGLEV